MCNDQELKPVVQEKQQSNPNNILSELQAATAARQLRYASVENQELKVEPVHISPFGTGKPSEMKKAQSLSHSAISTRIEEPTPVTSNMEKIQFKVEPKEDQSTRNPILSSGGWEERFTVDDVPYYYNTQQDMLSWEKPDCLLTEKEKQEGKRKWVWIENEQDGWIPLCVVRFVYHVLRIGE